MKGHTTRKTRVIKKAITILTAGALSVALTACEEEKDDDEDASSSNSGTSFPNSASNLPSGSTATNPDVPDTQSINLSPLGSSSTSSLSLSSDTKCDGASSRGIFGLALGGACHTSSFASDFLLGETNGGDFNEDGEIDCSDFTAATAAGEEPGVMFQLTCNSLFQTYAVQSIAFSGEEDDEDSMGISFADFTGDTNTGVGTWYAGNADSYPANMRIYAGSDISDMTGFVALDMTNSSNGTLWINLAERFEGEVTFDLKDDASGCSADPSTTTCHFQEVKLFNSQPSGNGDEPPLGFHIRIFADSVSSPMPFSSIS